MLNAFPAKIGYSGGADLATVAEVHTEASWAARAGFYGFWLSQHHAVDPLIALAAVTPAVPELQELGTAVVPIYGRHPFVMAGQVLTLQSAADGRFVLGIGPSHASVVEGVLTPSFARPYGVTASFLADLAPLLQRVEYDPGHGPGLAAPKGLDIDAPECSILLAALGPRMLELAGTVCAGTTLSACGPLTIAEHIVPNITAAAAAAERPHPRIMARVEVCITDDPQRLREWLTPSANRLSMLPSYRATLEREGVSSTADLVVAGCGDDVVRGLSRYVEAGATDLRLAIAASNDEERQATKAWLEASLGGPTAAEEPP